jgi:hypothetical protein
VQKPPSSSSSHRHAYRRLWWKVDAWDPGPTPKWSRVAALCSAMVESRCVRSRSRSHSPGSIPSLNTSHTRQTRGVGKVRGIVTECIGLIYTHTVPKKTQIHGDNVSKFCEEQRVAVPKTCADAMQHWQVALYTHAHSQGTLPLYEHCQATLQQYVPCAYQHSEHGLLNPTLVLMQSTVQTSWLPVAVQPNLQHQPAREWPPEINGIVRKHVRFKRAEEPMASSSAHVCRKTRNVPLTAHPTRQAWMAPFIVSLVAYSCVRMCVRVDGWVAFQHKKQHGQNSETGFVKGIANSLPRLFMPK